MVIDEDDIAHRILVYKILCQDGIKFIHAICPSKIFCKCIGDPPKRLEIGGCLQVAFKWNRIIVLYKITLVGNAVNPGLTK